MSDTNVGILATPNLQNGSATVEVHDTGIIGLNGNLYDIKFPRGYIYSQSDINSGLEQLVISSHSLKNEDYHEGSRLALHFGSCRVQPGSFELVAGSESDGSDSSILYGNPNRALAWCGYPISQLSMPSNKYIDLEIGANNFIYTAIANGYLTFHASSTQSASGAFIFLYNENTGVSSNIISTGLNQGLMCFVPVSKGQQIRVSYGGVSIDYLRFVYSVLDSIITE